MYVIFIMPLLVTVVGILMNKHSPKKVNYFIGYRTRKSMRDEKVWKMANEYCWKLWIKIGLIMIVIAFLLYILICLKKIILTETLLTIIIFCEIVPILLSGLMIEKKIKNRGDKNGK